MGNLKYYDKFNLVQKSELLAQGNYSVSSRNLYCSRNLIQAYPFGVFGLQNRTLNPLKLRLCFCTASPSSITVTAIITNLSFNDLLWVSSCSSSLFQYATTGREDYNPTASHVPCCCRTTRCLLHCLYRTVSVHRPSSSTDLLPGIAAGTYDSHQSQSDQSVRTSISNTFKKLELILEPTGRADSYFICFLKSH